MSVACSGLAHGWDIVLPSKWGMAFWVPLVYAGARTHGQLEMKRLALEAGLCFFPDDAVGSEAYASYSAQQKADRTATSVLAPSPAQAAVLTLLLACSYFKRPPAKRNNYDKLKEPSPFLADWSTLADSSLPVVLTRMQHQAIAAEDSAVPVEQALVHVVSAAWSGMMYGTQP